MTIQPFDYDAWRDASREDGVKLRDDWEQRGLHWHCYLARMDGNVYGNEGLRRDLTTTAAPKVIREWLRKPQSTLSQVIYMPEEGVTWLRAHWEPVAPLEDDRYSKTLYDLRCGGDVCWGEWINGGSTMFHTAIVGTSDGCHA